MARVEIHDRIAEVRGPGTLIVASDLHGNLRDFERLVELYEAEGDAVLFLLGDFVHGPSFTRELWEREFQHLGDWYADQSPALFEAIRRFGSAHRGRFACLMGNHEHGHIGGAIVAKFHPDEAEALESNLTKGGAAALRSYIRSLPLLGTTPCGVTLTHAAPPDAAFDRDHLRDLDLDGWRDVPPWQMFRAGFLGEILWRRGANAAITHRFLERVDALDPHSPKATCVVHGHEVVRSGYEIENDRLLTLSTSFGMRRAQKTYLKLDLSRRYEDATALRPSVELLPLWD